MNKVTSDARREKTPNLPKGDYDVIYADCPWKYDIPLRGDPEEHYQTLTPEEIMDIEPPAAKDAVLFMWAPNPQLENALDVMNKWGFSYKSNLVWVKDKIGTGYYFRGQHELLLICIRGKIGTPKEEDRPDSVIKAPVGKHSQKPEIIFSIIEKMYPTSSGHKYFEMFSRAKTERPGWKHWGLESVQLPGAVNMSARRYQSSPCKNSAHFGVLGKTGWEGE